VYAVAVPASTPTTTVQFVGEVVSRAPPPSLG